jgi:hypothetical protein
MQHGEAAIERLCGYVLHCGMRFGKRGWAMVERVGKQFAACDRNEAYPDEWDAARTETWKEMFSGFSGRIHRKFRITPYAGR